MSNTPHSTDLPGPPPSSQSATKEARRRAVRSPNALFRRRFGRTAGFWVGGALLGAGGCVLGGCMPYRHPVAVTISALWWGVYLGCFGAWIGALLGLWAEQTHAPPSRRSAGVGKPPSEADSVALPGGYCGTLIGDSSRDQVWSRLREGAPECTGVLSGLAAIVGARAGNLKSP